MRFGDLLRAAAIAGLFASAAAAGPTCAVVDPIWRGGHTSSQTALLGAVDVMSTMVASQSALTTQSLTSVVRVLTAQTATEGERTATAAVRSAEALANAINEQRSREAILEAEENYGPLGQAVDTCYVAGMSARVQEAFDAVGEGAREVVGNEDLDVRPGAVNDLEDVLSRRLTGYTPAAVNVASSLLNPDADADSVMFMNYVFGAPLRKPSSVTPGVESAAMLLDARRAEALRSPALVSMGAVRSMYHSHGHADAMAVAPGTLSTMQGLDWLIDRYGGGSEHEGWAAELATKSEAGLLKELARLRAIRLQIERLRMGSQARIQPVLATLLAAEIDG